MKIKVLMATLAMTFIMGVQGFASPCDSACLDPCSSCDRNVVKCDLFSGLKRLVNGVRSTHCDPCDAVVACNPCDDLAACNPCDDVCSLPRIGFGGRLRGLFSSPACNVDCDPCGFTKNCGPCDCNSNCGPCDDICGRPKFNLRGLFGGFRLRGCNTDCNPCDNVRDCDPCGFAANCDPCNGAANCGPCNDVCCDTNCGPRGRLIDLPRFSLKKLFSVRLAGCCDAGNNGCNPCDNVRDCLPCDRCR